jgi:hypothetical protein
MWSLYVEEALGVLEGMKTRVSQVSPQTRESCSKLEIPQRSLNLQLSTEQHLLPGNELLQVSLPPKLTNTKTHGHWREY